MKRTRNTQPSLILTSDWHLRETVPECRTDNFWATQWTKVRFVAALQKEYDCPVIHAGDLFHHWKPSPMLLSWTMRYLPDKFYTIYGQHDLPQHNWEERPRSGIHTLEQAGALTVLSGVHWGQDPKDHALLSFGHIAERAILVWHRMVWQGKRLWPGQSDPSAVAILKKYSDYDLIVTGDNHKPFVEEYQGRILVNAGSLTRQTADQSEHLPRVYLYDADSNSVRPVYLPIQKGDEVISRAHIDKNEERNDRITAFIDKLDGEWQAGMSFESNLEEFFKTNRVRTSVQNLTYKAIE